MSHSAARTAPRAKISIETAIGAGRVPVVSLRQGGQPGEHTVVMRHVAPALRTGLIVSLASAVLIALLWAIPFGRTRRRDAT